MKNTLKIKGEKLKLTTLGFTLIELLAVITILSVILMIVVVSVSSIITNSKNSLQKTQYNQILKAAEYYNNKEGLKDNDICVNVSYLTENGYLKEDEIKNPKNGKKIEGSVKIKYNGKKYTYEYRDKDCSICKAVDGEVSTTPGTKYSCEVKDNTNYTFYVLSEESDKVNLIMDRNICEDGSIKYTIANHYCRYSYHEEEDNSNYGPDTAMTNLYQATKDWTNVPNMIMNYTDENNTNNEAIGYKGIVTNSKTKITTIFGKNNVAETQIGTYEFPLKARLPMEYEIRGTACDGNYGSCPAWIVENLRYFDTNEYLRYDKYNLNYKNLDNTELGAITAYWLLSSYNDDLSKARILSCQGIVSSMKTHSRSGAGIRPVITVSIDNLSS